MKESQINTTASKEGNFWNRFRSLFTSKRSGEPEIATKEDLATVNHFLVLDDPNLIAVSEVGSTVDFAVDPEKEGVVTELEGESVELSEVGPELQKEGYLERLAELDLESVGNPYLKATIRDTFETWESQFKSEQSAALAERMQMSEAEVVGLLQKRIEEILQQSQFFCASETEVFINHILGGDRRFKTSLELQRPTDSSDYSMRSEKENEHFGFPSFYSAEGVSATTARPVYGYFAMDENGIFNDEGKHPPRNSVSMYGRVTVKIKKEVASKRATMCLRDTYFLKDVPVCPVALPHYSAFFYNWKSYQTAALDKSQKFLESPLDNVSLWNTTCGYTEAHFHGGLTVDDIESVHLSLGNGVTQEEIDEITAAVETYNRETGGNIIIITY